jgi:hypothetical protein
MDDFARCGTSETGTLSQSDPTDDALAAIASILDQPGPHTESEMTAEKPAVSGEIIYSKTGRGPVAALRFKWTARCDDRGDYYVDETIGENSQPITTGPMSKQAAIQFVDDRASEVRQRYEQIKDEMSGENSAVANLARKISGDM